MAPASDPLAALRDIHLPPAVSMWPPAPGWWIAAAVLAAAALAALLLLRRRRLGRRRAALVELEGIAASFARTRDVEGLAGAVSGLLRRVALYRFERGAVASLSGAEWSLFLVRTGGEELAADGGDPFWLAAFAGPDFEPRPGEPERWIEGARRWLRRNA